MRLGLRVGWLAGSITGSQLRQEREEEVNESERNAVEGVRALWPTLSMNERLQWVEELRGVFDDDFVTTIRTLAGHIDIR